MTELTIRDVITIGEKSKLDPWLYELRSDDDFFSFLIDNDTEIQSLADIVLAEFEYPNFSAHKFIDTMQERKNPNDIEPMKAIAQRYGKVTPQLTDLYGGELVPLEELTRISLERIRAVVGNDKLAFDGLNREIMRTDHDKVADLFEFYGPKASLVAKMFGEEVLSIDTVIIEEFIEILDILGENTSLVSFIEKDIFYEKHNEIKAMAKRYNNKKFNGVAKTLITAFKSEVVELEYEFRSIIPKLVRYLGSQICGTLRVMNEKGYINHKREFEFLLDTYGPNFSEILWTLDDVLNDEIAHRDVLLEIQGEARHGTGTIVESVPLADWATVGVHLAHTYHDAGDRFYEFHYGEIDEFEQQYGDLIREAREKLGINHIYRFNGAMNLIEDSLSLISSSKIEDKPFGVCIICKYDSSTAFDNLGAELIELSKGYNLLIYEVGSNNEASHRIKQAGRLAQEHGGKLMLTNLQGHGLPYGLFWDYVGPEEMEKLHWHFIPGPQYLSIFDNALITSWSDFIGEGSQFVLGSCSAGAGGKYALNLATRVKSNIPQTTLHASTSANLLYGYNLDSQKLLAGIKWDKPSDALVLD